MDFASVNIDSAGVTTILTAMGCSPAWGVEQLVARLSRHFCCFAISVGFKIGPRNAVQIAFRARAAGASVSDGRWSPNPSAARAEADKNPKSRPYLGSFGIYGTLGRDIAYIHGEFESGSLSDGLGRSYLWAGLDHKTTIFASVGSWGIGGEKKIIASVRWVNVVQGRG